MDWISLVRVKGYPTGNAPDFYWSPEIAKVDNFDIF
jgi:hypothetical protein